MRVSRRPLSTSAIATERFWQIAILTAAGAIGSISRADAALYYWQESPGVMRYDPMEQPRRSKVRRSSAKKDAVAEKDTGKKPQGPLIISVSINKQQVKVYDDNGLFAQAPVSSGMPGHSTPMGVFSVIQKHKWHHSNIYSGAPMPYMQRITWSGVALHAGVLPGYPASHGCIRMPTAFAIKMWNWTKMGARVLVTPGEIVPETFSHPLLATTKIAPQPVAAAQPQPDLPIGAKTDKGVTEAAKPNAKSADANVVDLRSTVGHEGGTQTRTADASSKSAVMTDAASGTGATSKTEVAADAKPSDTTDIKPIVEVSDVTTGSDTTKITDATTSAKADDKAADARTEATKTAEPKTGATKAEVSKADAPKADAAKAEAAKPNDRPADNTKATVAAPAPTSTPADGKKDETRLADTDKPVVAKPEPSKRSGQIAVFISRKDSKLYVRQNFSPLFEVPVTIASSDRPLGTHVFTAEVDKTDPNALRWTVVSLPVSARAARGEDGQRLSSRHGRKNAPPVEAKPLPVPDSPAEALDRITVPADAMARVVDAIATGGSIVVSDQGINQGETGEGTDFIVSLR
jgi:lipoprotein-anchoring transpeptidase ErfK/SrfK